MILSDTPRINAYNMDCMDFMADKKANEYNLAIVDPPYGIGQDGRIKRPHRARQRNGSVMNVASNNYKRGNWDSSPPNELYFSELFRISTNQIIWGINHFDISVGSGRIYWDKVNGDSDFSDGEIAYCSIFGSIRAYSFMWAGMRQGDPSDGKKMQGNKKLNEKRIHPTQKPVSLYRWLLKNYAKEGDKILDTHGGSMSIAIACYMEGFDLDIVELDEDYFNEAVKRFKLNTVQENIFKVKK